MPAHVFVGRDESLHQDVGVARHDGRDGQPHAVDVALFIHDLEDRTVDPLGPADLFDDLFVAVEGRFDQSLIICVVDGAERVGILAVGDGQPRLRPFFWASSTICESFVIIAV